MNAAELIQKLGLRLRRLLDPVLERDYPELLEDRELLWDHFLGSVEKWFAFMSLYIVPNRAMIGGSVIDDEAAEVYLPQLIPGISLKPVPAKLYQEVNGCLAIFLNLYDWLENE